MTGNEYQSHAMRTNDRKGTERLLKFIEEHKDINVGGLLNGYNGLFGEGGESCDMIKKWIFHEKPLDIEHFKKEIGDILWYVAMICESMNFDLDEIMQMNIDKLKARYPMNEGFTVERANNRAEGDV